MFSVSPSEFHWYIFFLCLPYSDFTNTFPKIQSGLTLRFQQGRIASCTSRNSSIFGPLYQIFYVHLHNKVLTVFSVSCSYKQSNLFQLCKRCSTVPKTCRSPTVSLLLGTVSTKILGGLNRFYGHPTSPSASIMAQNWIKEAVSSINAFI